MSVVGNKPIANPSIVYRDDFDNWAVLFDPDTAKMFGLNSTGIFIWKRLDGMHTVENIVTELHVNREDVPGEMDQHVRQLIDNLVERGLAGYTAQEV